jgi:hypothetical protein
MSLARRIQLGSAAPDCLPKGQATRPRSYQRTCCLMFSIQKADFSKLADFRGPIWGGLSISQLRQAAKARHDFLPDR